MKKYKIKYDRYNYDIREYEHIGMVLDIIEVDDNTDNMASFTCGESFFTYLQDIISQKVNGVTIKYNYNETEAILVFFDFLTNELIEETYKIVEIEE